MNETYETVVRTSNDEKLNVFKQELLQEFVGYQSVIKGIRLNDFRLGKNHVVLDLHQTLEEDIYIFLEERITACLKKHQRLLWLHNMRYIVVDEQEELTYETLCFWAFPLAYGEEKILREFGEFAYLKEEVVQQFIMKKRKKVCSLHDLLQLPNERINYWSDLAGVPKGIENFIEESCSPGRYETFTLKDIIDRLTELMDLDELTIPLTYEHGLLHELVEYRFGSMKYDW